MARIVNEDSKSYGDSLDMNSKVSYETASIAGETNVIPKQQLTKRVKLLVKTTVAMQKSMQKI